MKYRSIILIAALLGSILFLFLYSRDEQKQIPPLVVNEQNKNSPVPIKEKNLTPEVQHPIRIRKARSMKTVEKTEDAVFFERDGDLAVFYHDIILGEIKNAEGQNSGFAEAPKVELWDLPIRYVILQDLPDPKRVEEAIRYFNENTPIKFIPFKGEGEPIVFVNADEHCRSYLGKKGGAQPIYLSAKCGPQEILHELMHALGFPHEQSRENRDDYLEILWDNIDPTKIQQFQKIPNQMEVLPGSEFDLNSIMLYRPEIFAKEQNSPTMKSKAEQPIAPINKGLSARDLERLQRLYGYTR